MDLTNIDGSPLPKSMLGKPVIFATVPNGPAIKSRLDAEEHDKAMRPTGGCGLSAHGTLRRLTKVIVISQLSLRLSLTTAPDAQSMM
ncbi:MULTISPECIES: hypothetical protein [Bradyrhizobium]|jgi:hypothetical protein|uniref:hypothetical protein n=1 Tax=Bradyrhizobium TaxID=374 RepID=UPI0012BC671C|nr:MULTISPECIES: hypothetical protein [Bradyrhizobium]MCS3451755.1 hypothetical protein [Bradyrhizobium elkanii]MCS3566146.1 hypothetical protein [Bradyrhizobium elkanii]MCW2153124.1 hypothetical protein [Bradyrhizobium elkanii]MCW2357137.1 hypothetical protein [Bradyrhizobium elkanii]MCW2376857.1 hypothetical protein [Bradyrhizobium elkanii]